MELIPWVFTTGWASGINAYLVVFLLGGVERLQPMAHIPDALARTDVLIVSGVLFLLEVFADKIPYLDSIWDSVHTVIRPATGAALAFMISGDASSFGQASMTAIGGLSALASHGVKAGTRAAINTSPEPASNIAVSIGEDVAAATLVSLGMFLPWVAAGIAGVLLVAGLAVVIALLSRIRRWRRGSTERELEPGHRVL